MVLDMVDVSRIHPERFILIFKSLPSLKVIQLLGSPEHHLSVILGVLEDSTFLGSAPSLMCLQSVIQVSSLETKRMLEVPVRSLCGF